MKIRITGGSRDIDLTLPTKLILNKFVVRMALKSGRLEENPGKLPPQAADRLIEELNRIKKKHGTWELVEVQSSDGEHVKITL